MHVVSVDEVNVGLGGDGQVAFLDETRWIGSGRCGLWLVEAGAVVRRADIPLDPAGRLLLQVADDVVLVGPWIFRLTDWEWEELPPLLTIVHQAPDLGSPRTIAVTGSAWGPEGRSLLITLERRPSRIPDRPEGIYRNAEQVLLFDGLTRRKMALLLESSGWERHRTLASSADYFAAGGVEVVVWRRQDNAQVARLRGHTAAVRDLRFAAAGYLCGGSADGGIALWQPPEWRLTSWPAHDGSVTAVAWRSDSAVLATGGEDGRVRLWSASGSLLGSVETGEAVAGLSFAPSGLRLAAVAHDRVQLLAVDLDNSGPGAQRGASRRS